MATTTRLGAAWLPLCITHKLYHNRICRTAPITIFSKNQRRIFWIFGVDFCWISLSALCDKCDCDRACVWCKVPLCRHDNTRPNVPDFRSVPLSMLLWQTTANSWRILVTRVYTISADARRVAYHRLFGIISFRQSIQHSDWTGMHVSILHILLLLLFLSITPWRLQRLFFFMLGQCTPALLWPIRINFLN